MSFRRMDQGTREQFHAVDAMERQWAEGLVDRLLQSVRSLADEPTAMAIDRCQHSLQTATRALRDGASDAWVAAALLHDVGDHLAPYNHGEFAAAILRPYVDDQVHWVVQMHPVFQSYYFAHHFGGDRHARDAYRDHPHYDACVRFCAQWDQTSFDPDYDTLPLEHFRPVLQRVFVKR